MDPGDADVVLLAFLDPPGDLGDGLIDVDRADADPEDVDAGNGALRSPG